MGSSSSSVEAPRARDAAGTSPSSPAPTHVEPVIENKDSILSEVDRVLGVSKPPDVEFFLVQPFSQFRVWRGYGFGINAYGHAAVRYTMPDGTQKVMNIVGGPRTAMVMYCHPSDYLFSATAAEQGGIFNRDIVSVRIENVAPDRILAMDEYFEKLAERNAARRAKFNIAFGPVFNLLGSLVPERLMSMAERGNCAMYTSKGLQRAGVLHRWSMWPKSIWIHMFEASRHGPPGNMHVVSYRRVRDVPLRYGVDATAIRAVAPLQSIRSLFYYNLERFAHVIVEVPPGTHRAVVTRQPDPAPPSALRDIVNSRLFIGTSVLVTLAVLGRQYRAIRMRPR